MSSQKSQLTFIVPLDFSRRGLDIYKRAIRLADFFERNEIYISFGINENSKYAKFIMSKYINSNFVKFGISNSKVINLSALRNIALQKVNTPYVVFLDVDIFMDDDSLNIIINSNLNRGMNIFPCLYLTKKSNSYILKKNRLEMINLYYSYRRDLFLHLAFPSFVMVCDFASLKEIDFFDEFYLNHGYEDFDLIIRVMIHKGFFDNDSLSLKNNKYRSIAEMSGYRLSIAKYFLDNVAEDKFLFHIYHEKNKGDVYYSDCNKNYFVKKIKTHLDSFNTSKNEFNDNFYIVFRHYCMSKKINMEKYSVFFDPMPGHMWRCFGFGDYMRKKINTIFRRFKSY